MRLSITPFNPAVLLALLVGCTGFLSAQDIDSNLLLHYTFDDPDNLGIDESGNGFDAVPAGGVTFSPDGRLLASGGWDGTVKLWNVAEKSELATLEGHDDIVLAVNFSPDGKSLASAGYDQIIRLWDVEPLLNPESGN